MSELLPMMSSIVLTFAVAVVATLIVRRLALRFGVLDRPEGERKKHARPTPLLGGAAVIAAVSVGVSVAWPQLIGGYLLPKHLIGLFFGAATLLIGGALDDKFNLSPRVQFIFPVVAALAVIGSGIGIDYITNPLGSVLRLDSWSIELFRIGELPYQLTVWADLFTFIWLLGMVYTTKFLDGLDGLVSGVSVIGAVIIAVLSLTATVYQPETAHLSLLVGAAFLGFLVFNWNPASIFLGESGSLFAGFALGVLAIISGGKIATTLLILGIPILDVAWVIIRRLLYRKSPFAADRGHLHLRLVDSGLSVRRVVLLLYTLTVLFGISSLFLQSTSKVWALLVLGATAVFIGGVLVRYIHTQRS